MSFGLWAQSGGNVIFEEGFNTTMANMSVMGWTGDFDMNTLFNEGWTIANGPSTASHVNPSDATGPSGPQEGSQYLYYESSGPAAVNAEGTITSPMISIPTDHTASLSFYIFMHGADVNAFDLNVLSGGAEDEVVSYMGERQTSKTDKWEEVIVDLSSYAGQDIQLQFRAQKNIGGLGDVAIDNVQVTATAIPEPIPTLGEWGIMLLGLSLLIMTIVHAQSQLKAEPSQLQ